MDPQIDTTSASLDGLIRLTLAQLQDLPLQHLVSGLDEGSSKLSECGHAVVLSGYTEWVAHGDVPVTLGWDWRAEAGPGGLRWSRVGAPFSNLMLVTRRNCDYGWSRNLAALSRYVDQFGWRPVLAQALAKRYG